MNDADRNRCPVCVTAIPQGEILCDDCGSVRWKKLRDTTDGESRDKNGYIRPVPPGVPNIPEGDR